MNPIDVFVGERVKTRRKMLGLTQQQLAETLDLTFQQVQKYERGSNRISASKLFIIAEQLQVPISYFFSGLDQHNGDMSNPGFSEFEDDVTDQLIDFASSSEGRELNLAFAKISSPSVRRYLVNLFQAIAEG